VVIQNAEKCLQGTMFFRYFMEKRIENDIKKFTQNPKDGLFII
jgi:hypothetical protein